MLPVMLVTMTIALQSGLILPYLWWGVPLAVLVATAWTRYRLSRTVAEIRVQPPEAAARSVLDYLRGVPPEWGPIVELRDHSSELSVTIGLESFVLQRRDWPDADAMLDALIDARHARDSMLSYPS